MFKKKTTRNRILRSENYLTPNYDPEKPIGRENKVQKIVDSVRPLIHRKTPEALLVYGPTGVGKTTSIRYVFERLEQETTAKSIYINCWKYNTRPSLLTELLIQLGYPAPRKGKPVDELLSKIREWLDKNRGVAVALDEFDQLTEPTEVVYDLQLVNEEADNKIGLVLVSNQHPSQIQLDSRSRSRLNCQTLEFTSYTTPELAQILKHRAEYAFKPRAIDTDVIETISEHVADKSGDCREALQLLLQAGRKAELQGENKITDQILEEVAQ